MRNAPRRAAAPVPDAVWWRAALRSAWSWCPHAVHRKRACERRESAPTWPHASQVRLVWLRRHEHDARRLVAQHWLERRPAGREHDAIEPGLGAHVRTGRLDGAFGRTRHRPRLEVLSSATVLVCNFPQNVVTPVLATIGEPSARLRKACARSRAPVRAAALARHAPLVALAPRFEPVLRRSMNEASGGAVRDRDLARVVVKALPPPSPVARGASPSVVRRASRRSG